MSSTLTSFAGRRRFDAFVLAATILIGGVYVGLRLSPSSYAVMLKHIGVKDTGLVTGRPRPIRSDEWAHLTPWMQSAVRSGFSRYNGQPPHHEDFRSVYGMPIVDWGLVFKPTMWLFPTASPAVAYSFHFFALAAGFILGFYFMFVAMGISRPLALLGALTLYCSGFTQYWWSVNAPAMAFLPWIVLVLVAKLRALPKAALLFWLCTSWQLELFYPPFLIQFAFFAAIVYVTLRWRSLLSRETVASLVAGAASIATVVLYLREEIWALARTVDPGRRSYAAGGMGLDQWLTLFAPTGGILKHQSTIGLNICEIGVVGSWLLAASLCFVDHRRLRDRWRARLRWSGALRLASSRRHLVLPVALLCAFVLASAWVLLPLPRFVGYPLLWHLVQPSRMGFLLGTLLTTALLLLLTPARFVISARRVAAFCAIVAGAWLAFKYARGLRDPLRAWKDWAVVPFLFASLGAWCAWRVWRRRADARGVRAPLRTAAIASVAAANVVAFGDFNPVQRADPIFARHDTPTTRVLDRLQAEQREKGYVAVPARLGFPGSTLTGLGYPSVSHATFRPNLEFWRRLYPDMPENEFSRIFNRAAHALVDEAALVPMALPGVYVVPMSSLVPEIRALDVRATLARPDQDWIRRSLGAPKQGFVESAVRTGDVLRIAGWAPWTGRNGGQGLRVFTRCPVKAATLITGLRGDVQTAFPADDRPAAGFQLSVQLFEECSLSREDLCLVGFDDAGESVLGLRNVDGSQQQFCAQIGGHAAPIRSQAASGSNGQR